MQGCLDKTWDGLRAAYGKGHVSDCPLTPPFSPASREWHTSWSMLPSRMEII